MSERTEELTHYKSMLDSDSLGTWDLVDPRTKQPRDVTVEIEKVERFIPARPRKKKVRALDGTVSFKDEPNRKLLLSFKGKRKKWIAGTESLEIIAALYGVHVQRWIGKRLTLWINPGVLLKGKKVGGIRPRPIVPGTNVEMTIDPLDEPIDEARAQAIEDAFMDEEENSPG